jgi:hypothetical protein
MRCADRLGDTPCSAVTSENWVWRDTFEPDSAARFFALIGASPVVIADPLRTMSAPPVAGQTGEPVDPRRLGVLKGRVVADKNVCIGGSN